MAFQHKNGFGNIFFNFFSIFSLPLSPVVAGIEPLTSG
jgi:hypothetical protein